MSSPLTDRLIAAIGVLHAGNRIEARALFLELERELAHDDHFHRCVLAHYMADAQDDAADELRWDRLALDAALQATPSEFDGRFPGMTRASFFPSLHLNVAASCEKLGLRAEAIAQAELAHRALGDLQDTPLGQLTRDAIRRLRTRLEAQTGPA